MLVIHPPYEHVYSDMQGYVDRAVRLASGAELMRPDAFYPPGTHLVLAVPFALLGTGDTGLRAAALLWWALSSATPLFAWRFARRLLRPEAAALTALLCALYPLFVFYAGFFSSETPALAFLTCALWLGQRARQTDGRAAQLAALGTGLAGAIAVAARPQYLLNLAIVAAPVLWHWRARWRSAAALVGAAAVVLAGVIAYETAAAGRLTGIGENGGLIFYQAHCDVRMVTAGTPERGGVFAFANPTTLEHGRGRDVAFPDHQGWDQRFFYGEGLDCIRDNGPGHVSRLLRNAIDATATATPFPLGDPPAAKPVARAFNLGYTIMLPLIVVGSVLILRRRRSRRDPPRERELLLHLASVLPVVMIFSSEPRYRIPYDLFGLALLASLIVAGRVCARQGPRNPLPGADRSST